MSIEGNARELEIVHTHEETERQRDDRVGEQQHISIRQGHVPGT